MGQTLIKVPTKVFRDIHRGAGIFIKGWMKIRGDDVAWLQPSSRGWGQKYFDPSGQPGQEVGACLRNGLTSAVIGPFISHISWSKCMLSRRKGWTVE